MKNFKFGIGLLETLTASLYENPIVLFREYVQNSVDAYNNEIKENIDLVLDFKVKLDIDKTNRTITICDNGYGIKTDNFKIKMIGIGNSNKGKLPNQIGFRGIGRLSGMPFCKELVFTNKVAGKTEIQKCIWLGEKYNNLLLQSNDDDLDVVIEEITDFSNEEYSGDASDHFFKVTIIEYNIEIQKMLSSRLFKKQLRLVLPLRYSPEFTISEKIHKEYFKHMNKSYSMYEISILLDDVELYKDYNNNSILQAGINVWPIKIPTKSDVKIIGIIWYTFNVKMSNQKNSNKGIMVRSKNMLMGNGYTIADVVSKGEKYISTHRELTQTLTCVYGEVLIDTEIETLVDNARRDWFKINMESLSLSAILAEFLKRLLNYRYTASKVFSGKEPKKELMKAARDLIIGEYNISDVFDIEYEKQKRERVNLEFADVDVPSLPTSKRRFYELFMKILHDYFVESKDLKKFAKIRAFFRKKFTEE